MPSVTRLKNHRALLLGALALLAAMVLGLVVIVAVPNALDAAWMSALLGARTHALLVWAVVMDFLGGGWFAVFVVPLGGGAVLLLRRRPWAALFFVLALAVSAGIVQVLKNLLGRARPEDILILADFGSFPSGHTANAATLAVVLGLLLQRRWVWIAGIVWTLLMLFSRTLLGAHWLTDTLGGILVGAGSALLVWALLQARVGGEGREA